MRGTQRGLKEQHRSSRWPKLAKLLGSLINNVPCPRFACVADPRARVLQEAQPAAQRHDRASRRLRGAGGLCWVQAIAASRLVSICRVAAAVQPAGIFGG